MRSKDTGFAVPHFWAGAYAGGRTDFAWWKFKPKSASSILQSSILSIFQLQFACLYVPSFQEWFVFRSVQKLPSGFFQTGLGVFLALCWPKAILDCHFLEITSLPGLHNFNRQSRQDRAWRIELADLGLNFLL